ncbi:hypothetical protein C5025_004606 [Salmonella enterica subsp. enterica serovar Chailey]|nr:hypothetical protein [Salmonella enterica subsp. enterica serovar Chailey]
MSVDFCDARQGGGAYGKTPAARPFVALCLFTHMFFPAFCCPLPFYAHVLSGLIP